MKKQFFMIALCISSFLSAQSIKFTSTELTTAKVGSTITVDYKYTATEDGGIIICGINLLDDWTGVSNVDYISSPAVKGTNMTGSLTLKIPKGTKLSADLKGKLNYKIKIELKQKTGNKWLAGDYPKTQINVTAPL